MLKKTIWSQRAINKITHLFGHKAKELGGNNRPDFNVLTKTVGSSPRHPLYDSKHVSIKIKKEMRKDPQIRLALSVIKAPILGMPLQANSKDADIDRKST